MKSDKKVMREIRHFRFRHEKVESKFQSQMKTPGGRCSQTPLGNRESCTESGGSHI